jgi:uncharacterized repeat protein (TIGR01451 family)
MTRQSYLSLIALLLPLLAAAAEHSRAPAGAAAPKGGCIVLTTAAEQEHTVTAADGSSSKQYQPATRVVPGTEVVWSTTARNTCSKPAEKVVIDQPVPEHMVFVADSAVGGGAQITLSVDGREYLPAAQLTARNADGSPRPARAGDVRFVRWTLSAAIAPQSEFTARFRAVLQ